MTKFKTNASVRAEYNGSKTREDKLKTRAPHLLQNASSKKIVFPDIHKFEKFADTLEHMKKTKGSKVKDTSMIIEGLQSRRPSLG